MGGDEVEERVALPFRGFVKALVPGRIPYNPVHIDNLEEDSMHLKLLVMPDLAATHRDRAVSEL